MKNSCTLQNQTHILTTLRSKIKGAEAKIGSITEPNCGGGPNRFGFKSVQKPIDRKRDTNDEQRSTESGGGGGGGGGDDEEKRRRVGVRKILEDDGKARV